MPQEVMGFVRQIPDVGDRFYAGGLFDGEGSVFFVQTERRTWQLRAQIGLTHLPTLEWFRERWGGTVRPTSRNNPRWAPAWQWTLSQRQALPFLTDIAQIARIKREQIANGLAFLERMGRGHRKLPAERAELAAFAARSRELNRRGPR